MHEEDRDIVEFIDEEGGSIELEVIDTFFYNGEEFAVLVDAEEGCDCGCEECDHEEHEEGCDCGCEGEDVYLMKIIPGTDENGEEIEEFVPVEDDDLMEKLIEVVQTRFMEDDEEEEE